MNKAAKKYIAENYGTMRPKEIAAEIGQTADYVRQVARRMGLYRGKGYKSAPRSRCKGCVMLCNGECLARLESCNAARFTKAKWPDFKKRINYFD